MNYIRLYFAVMDVCQRFQLSEVFVCLTHHTDAKLLSRPIIEYLLMKLSISNRNVPNYIKRFSEENTQTKCYIEILMNINSIIKLCNNISNRLLTIGTFGTG